MSAATSPAAHTSTFRSHVRQFEKDSLYSWVICLAAFVVQVVAVGIVNSFGVFFVEFLHEFRSTKAELSWIGSLAFGMGFSLGPLAGAFRTRFGARIAICLGSFMCGLSLFTSSFAVSTKTLFFTFSTLYAVGAGLIVNSTTILAVDYFDKYVTIVTGIIVSGSSFGTLLFSFISQLCVDSIGWRDTFRIYAGLAALNICMGLLVPSPRTNDSRNVTDNTNEATVSRRGASIKLWKNKPYIIWVIAATCAMFGYYIPYVHLVSFATDAGMSKESGSILIMVMGGISGLARIFFGRVVAFQFLNKRQLCQVALIVNATATMMVPVSMSFGALLLYVIIVGLVDGCFVVLLPLLTRAYAGQSNVAIAWGVLNAATSITFVMGPVLAGALYDATGSYNFSFHVAGIPVIAGAVVLFFMPWAQRVTQKEGHFDEIELENNYQTEGSYPGDPSQRAVGQTAEETNTYHRSLDEMVVENNGLIPRRHRSNLTILDERDWNWTGARQTLDIDHEPLQTELQNRNENIIPSPAEECQYANEEFALRNMTDNDTMEDFPQDRCSSPGMALSKTRQNDDDDHYSRPTSPVILPETVIKTLVELNEKDSPDSYNHEVVEQLVAINEGGVDNASFESPVRVTRSASHNVSEQCESPNIHETQGVVIPDYVVEKLVELNEGQNSNVDNRSCQGVTDNVVQKLVRFDDAEIEDHLTVESNSASLETQSTVDHLIELNSVTHTPPTSIALTNRQPSNDAIPRQISDSQCIISDNIVETLESLAIGSQNSENQNDESQGNDQNIWKQSGPSVNMETSNVNSDPSPTSWASNLATIQEVMPSADPNMWMNNPLMVTDTTPNQEHAQLPQEQIHSTLNQNYVQLPQGQQTWTQNQDQSALPQRQQQWNQNQVQLQMQQGHKQWTQNQEDLQSTSEQQQQWNSNQDHVQLLPGQQPWIPSQEQLQTPQGQQQWAQTQEDLQSTQGRSQFTSNQEHVQLPQGQHPWTQSQEQLHLMKGQHQWSSSVVQAPEVIHQQSQWPDIGKTDTSTTYCSKGNIGVDQSSPDVHNFHTDQSCDEIYSTSQEEPNDPNSSIPGDEHTLVAVADEYDDWHIVNRRSFLDIPRDVSTAQENHQSHWRNTASNTNVREGYFYHSMAAVGGMTASVSQRRSTDTSRGFSAGAAFTDSLPPTGHTSYPHFSTHIHPANKPQQHTATNTSTPMCQWENTDTHHSKDGGPTMQRGNTMSSPGPPPHYRSDNEIWWPDSTNTAINSTNPVVSPTSVQWNSTVDNVEVPSSSGISRISSNGGPIASENMAGLDEIVNNLMETIQPPQLSSQSEDVCQGENSEVEDPSTAALEAFDQLWNANNVEESTVNNDSNENTENG